VRGKQENVEVILAVAKGRWGRERGAGKPFYKSK